MTQFGGLGPKLWTTSLLGLGNWPGELVPEEVRGASRRESEGVRSGATNRLSQKGFTGVPAEGLVVDSPQDEGRPPILFSPPRLVFRGVESEF